MTPSRPRVDFAVPSDARRSRCRYCLQTVYWATDVFRGPLHAASAIRNGDKVTRMEAHAAHCPKRATASEGAKTQVCPGRGCRERIETGSSAPVLCRVCWGLVPATTRAWVAREASRRPRTTSFDEAVLAARHVVGKLRNGARPRTAPTLFPGLEGG